MIPRAKIESGINITDLKTKVPPKPHLLWVSLLASATAHELCQELSSSLQKENKDKEQYKRSSTCSFSAIFISLPFSGITVVLSIWGLHHNPCRLGKPRYDCPTLHRFPFTACWSNPTGANLMGQIGAQIRGKGREKGSEEAERRFVAYPSLLKL